MRRYETIYIIRPNVNEDDITAIIDRTNAVIEQFGGSIVQQDRWGLKKLAYTINKETQGYYVYTEYAGAPAAVSEIERLFRINEKVLRYMTIKTEEEFTEGYTKKPAVSSDAVSIDESEDESDES
jgi:small subunit ribosomal protein S6